MTHTRRAYIHTNIHIHTCIYAYMQGHTHAHVHAHTTTDTHTQAHTHANVHTDTPLKKMMLMKEVIIHRSF